MKGMPMCEWRGEKVTAVYIEQGNTRDRLTVVASASGLAATTRSLSYLISLSFLPCIRAAIQSRASPCKPLQALVQALETL